MVNVRLYRILHVRTDQQYIEFDKLLMTRLQSNLKLFIQDITTKRRLTFRLVSVTLWFLFGNSYAIQNTDASSMMSAFFTPEFPERLLLLLPHPPEAGSL